MAKPNAIDQKLDELVSTLRPGETLTQREIARHCKCAQSNIAYIEKSALAKLRRRHGWLKTYLEA